MKQSIMFMFLLLIVGALATAVIAPNITSTYAQIEAAPPSAFDMVMESRQTPVIAAQAAGGGWVWVLAVLMVLAIVAGIIVAVSRGGGEMLRQWRLTFKQRGRQVASTTIPNLTEAEWNAIQTARSVPKLESDNKEVNHGYMGQN